MDNSKETVKQIVEAVGSEAIEEKLGVSEFAIRSAKRNGKFPGIWYGPLLDLCRDRDLECPLSVFNWKSPPTDANQQEAG